MWNEIKGFPAEAYRINEEGIIQSHKYGRWKTMKPYLSGRRATIRLHTADGEIKVKAVAILVAEAFLQGKKEGYYLYHRNGAAFDCSIWNLEYRPCNSHKHGTKAVIEYDRDGEVTAIYPSAYAAAKRHYVSSVTIRTRCRGEVKEPFELLGVSFRYDEDKGGRPKKCEED